MYTATYSPDDNKLRLYASTRLDAETYARVKAAGFKWAPKQELFVAPMWTPSREDLFIELAGEIEDEDKSLTERAEERAERFEDYSDNRKQDADRAHAAVHAIADNIPLGQPILVGHHSERHARKDAAKIENGMRRAVKMWEQSKYWTDRAAGAIRHAKYKERSDVRARRIKTIEADKRKVERNRDNSQGAINNWRHVASIEDAEKRNAAAKHVANVSCGLYFQFPLDKYPRKEGASTYEGDMSLWSAMDGGIIDGAQAAALALPCHERYLPTCERWIAHYENRIAYERAMLDEAGGLVAEQQEIAVGGRVLVRGEWVTVLRINRKDGKVCSFTTNRRYVNVVGVEEVKGYEAPSQEQAAAAAERMKKGTLCNYPGERFATCTQAEWDKMHKDRRGYKDMAPTETTARHRVRQAIGWGVHLPEKAGKELETHYCDANRTHTYWPVFVTDAKRIDPPRPTKAPEDLTTILPPQPDIEALKQRAARLQQQEEAPPDAGAKFDALKDTLKAGVKVVSAPQLFPTPPDLARRMVQEANIRLGMTVLEPSAGTGNLCAAILDVTNPSNLFAVEINHQLCELLSQKITPPQDAAQGICKNVLQGDFLECNGNLGKFDRVLMNPPFANGDDIKHITHAIGFLKPGGRLVAICANGPRQNEKLKPLIEENGGTWEPLPAGTFAESGTGVNTALLIYDAPEQPERLTLFD